MGLPVEPFDALADLLTYPGFVGWERQLAAITLLREACPATDEPLSRFDDEMSELGEGEREELFTRTFDHTDTRSLEIGWQLFGENYARGALMVRLRGLLREHGVPETSELPDHLTHVLRLVGRAPEPLARALIGAQVMQAIDKILAACRKFESPYCGVLLAACCVLEQHAAPRPGAVTR